MKKKSIWEKIKDNMPTYEQHDAFRRYYDEKQSIRLLIAAICGFAYSILGRIGFALWGIFDIRHTQVEYGYLISFSTVFLMLTIFGVTYIAKKDSPFKYSYFEVLSLIMAIGYLLWSEIAIYFSVIDDIAINVLPTLSVYILCNLFFYYNIWHYIAIAFTFFVMTGAEIIFMPSSSSDAPTILNMLILGIFVTIGGLARYRRALKEFEANQKTLESLNSQKFFVNSMNHELRSPLNGILGLLDILNKDDNFTESQKDYINKAVDSSRILMRIVNDLLDYAKMDAGEFPIVNEKCDLRSLISNIKGNSIPQCAVKRLEFTLSVDEEMPCMIYGDLSRIEQIVMNLVSNSIKYTDIGFIKVDIRIVEGMLTFIVEDTGYGMSKEMLKNLYVPFKRDESNNKAIQGTGLGLAIVHRLIDQMEGTIEVTSEIELGTTFKVRIPVTIADEDLKVGSAESIKSNTTQIPDFSGKRILCVDDNNVNIMVFKGLLKKTGCLIDSALSGRASIQLTQIYKYDIIFMDHMMPEMDGVETFKRIRGGFSVNKNVPIVALTANAGSEAEVEYKEIGFDGYLPKPLERQSLYDMLFDLLYKESDYKYK